MVLVKVIGFGILLSLGLSGCERIPEWEKSKVASKNQDRASRLAEWSRWLWTCRATGYRSPADQEVESFRDFFRKKNLSSIDTAGPKAIVGSALLWDDRGHLLISFPNRESARDFECRSASQVWLPAKLVGFDYSLDYAVLKVDLPRSGRGENPWLTRNEDLHLDEGFQILSSVIPGQIDQMRLELQTVGPHLNTGIDSQLLVFLPPPPALMTTGFLVDEKLRVVGFQLATGSQAWTVGVSVKRMRDSVSAILSGNPLRRAYLGLKLQVESESGFVVQSVQVGSPAYQSGLRPQDQILEWDGSSLAYGSEWRELSAADIGRTIRFKFKRGTSVTDAILKVTSQD